MLSTLARLWGVLCVGPRISASREARVRAQTRGSGQTVIWPLISHSLFREVREGTGSLAQQVCHSLCYLKAVGSAQGEERSRFYPAFSTRAEPGTQ